MAIKSHKRIIFTTAISALSLFLGNTAFAQNEAPTYPNSPESAINQFKQQINSQIAKNTQITDQSLSELGVEIKNLFLAGFQFFYQQNYQQDQNITTVQALNTLGQNVTVSDPLVANNNQNAQVIQSNAITYTNANPYTIAEANAQQTTQASLNNSLMQFNMTFRPEAPKTFAPGKKQVLPIFLLENSGTQAVRRDDYQNAGNSISSLSGVKLPLDNSSPFTQNTNSTPAYSYITNDMMYLPSNKIVTQSNVLNYIDPNQNLNLNYEKDVKPYITKPKPKEINNQILNFGSVVTPISYTPNQLQNAKSYLKYVAQNTINLFSKDSDDAGASLYGIKLNLDQLYNLPKAEQTAAALYFLKKDPQYQEFKFKLRAKLATMSSSLNILNGLVSERTPVKGLGTQNGLPTQNASPLQVTSYIATHRVRSTSWYNQIQNASPATLQRKEVVILAEIEAQNFQNHLDNERILTQLAILNLNSQQQALQGYLQENSQKLNDAVNKAISNVQKANKKTASNS